MGSSNAPNHAADKGEKMSPRCRILLAARELFFSKGIAAVTTDMLAKTAKTSKMTLYKYFTSKDQIFEQLVDDDVGRMFAPLDTNMHDKDSFTSVLFEFCQNLVNTIFDPEIVRFEQLMVSQALSNKKLTQSHYNKTHQPTIERIVVLLEFGQTQNYIGKEHSAALLTDMLISCLSGLSHTRALHGFEDHMKGINIEIASIVKLILGLSVNAKSAG